MARRTARPPGRQATLFAHVAQHAPVPAERRQAIVDALADLLLDACREEPREGGEGDEPEDHT